MEPGKPLPQPLQLLLHSGKSMLLRYPFLSGFISTFLISTLVVILFSLVVRGRPERFQHPALGTVVPTDVPTLVPSIPATLTLEPTEGSPESSGEGGAETNIRVGHGVLAIATPSAIPTNLLWLPNPVFTGTPSSPTDGSQPPLRETAAIPLPTTLTTASATTTLAISPKMTAIIPMPVAPTPLAEQPTPSPEREYLRMSKGIGLDIASWEAMHGQPTGENPLGYEYQDGAFIVIPQKNHVIWYLERVWNEEQALPLDDAKKIARSFIPKDHQFLGSQQTQTLVERYHSPWLTTRFPQEMDWSGGRPGDFVIVYTIQNNRVISFMITTEHDA